MQVCIAWVEHRVILSTRLYSLYIIAGGIRVHYSITSGHVTDLNEELEEALLDVDFVGGPGFIDIADGANSGRLPLNITNDEVPELQEVFLASLTSE